MKQLWNDRPLWVYLLLSFGLAWAVWLLGGLLYGPLGALPAASAQLFTALGMFAPLAAALLTGRLCPGGREPTGWKPRLRGNMKRYLLALWEPAAVTALGAVLYFALLPQSFDPNMGYMETVYIAQFGEEVYRAQGGAELLRLSMVSQIAMALTVAPFMNLLFALGEEVGWRGWLYPRLISRLGVTRGVLAGGVIWGLWHLPVTVNGHNYGVGYPGWPVAGVLAMCLFCFSAGVCLCWLTVRSGSIWPAALAHGAINAVGAAGQFFLPAEGANLLFGPAPAGVLAGLPLLALALLALRHLRKLEHTPMPIQTEEL